MKIGIFTDTFYPEINGVATSCLNLQNELLKKGHDVHVFAPKCEGYEQYQNENIHYIDSFPLFLLKDRNMAFAKKRDVIKAARMNFDIIHTNSEFFMGHMGIHVANIIKCPRIHTYHTIWEDYTYYITHGIADKFAKITTAKYSKWYCNKFERIIVPSDKTKELLISYDVNLPIDVIPSGIDISRFLTKKHSKEEILKTKKECGLKETDKVLLYIGRIAKEKNIESIVEALPEAITNNQNLKFLIIGEGPNIANLKEMAKKLNVADNIIFLGPRKWEVIDKYYAVGDVFISASHSETQGLTYLEAMASNLVICAVKDPCIEGLIENNVSGYVFEDNPTSINEAINKAFSKDSNTIKENYQNYINSFSLETFASKVEKAYLQAIEMHKKR